MFILLLLPLNVFEQSEDNDDDEDEDDNVSEDNDETIESEDHACLSKSNTHTKEELIQHWRGAGLSEVIDITYYLTALDRHIIHGKGYKKVSYNNVPEHIAGGATQIGKTGYKALAGILCRARSVVTVVVTTTRDLRNQLVQTLNSDYFSLLPEHIRPRCMSVTKPRGDPRSASEYAEDLQRCLADYGVLVVNCSKYSVDRVCSKIAEVRGRNRRLDFVLVKDESDVLNRTSDGRLQLEMAMDRLTGKIRDECGGRMSSPLVILNVSATVLPIYLRLQAEGRTDVTPHFGKPEEGRYVGIEDLRPLHGQFLADRELRCRSRPVPYWSDRVQALYADAHPRDPALQRRGVLLLDAANPRVKVEGNTRARAEWVQSCFPRFTVIVIWGAGVAVRFPGGEWVEGQELDALVKDQRATGRISRRAAQQDGAGDGREDDVEGKTTVSDVLSAVVCLRGLGAPVAVLGYTRLLRGESFRSSAVARLADGRAAAASATAQAGMGYDSLVPTHILCGLGDRHSFENLVQMAGRATGNFRSELADNGHEAVTILCGWRDFDAMRAYLRFQRELGRRIQGGEKMEVALGEDSLVYSAMANFARNCRRTVGSSRMGLELRANFEEAGLECAEFADELLGWSWAQREGMPCFGPHGQPFRLDSPLRAEERAALSDDGRLVEEHLYHTKQLSNPVSLALRQALSKLQPGDESSADYWAGLLAETPVLRYDRSGTASVEVVTRRLRCDGEGRYMGGLVEARGTELVLSKAVSSFKSVAGHRLRERPPAWGWEHLQSIADEWNRRLAENGHIANGTGSSACKKEAAAGGESEYPTEGGFASETLAQLLGHMWSKLDVDDACRKCREMDLAAFGMRRGRACGNTKEARLRALCEARPAGTQDAEGLLKWLVKVCFAMENLIASLTSAFVQVKKCRSVGSLESFRRRACSGRPRCKGVCVRTGAWNVGDIFLRARARTLAYDCMC